LLALGWQGTAAIALAVFAVALFLFTIAPLQAQVEGLRTEVEALESRSAAQPVAAQLPQGPEQQLAAFYSQLASSAHAPELLRQLHSLAQADGLRLERGEYRPVSEGKSDLLAYQITLPVRGAYPQVRRFLDQAMREMPGLALDGIAFQRETAGSALEAQLRFTLFLRKST
jgi:Tfp pilus assembly protein PilO